MARKLDLSKLTILLVDDNSYMRAILRALLRGFGVRQIQEASDAIQAFELFSAMEIDIILLDYMMQPLNGIEFTEMLRRADDSPNHKVPIIVVSAYCNRSTIEQARDAGVNEFVGKPVCATDLYMRITTVIENPRAFVTSNSGFFGPDRRRKTGGLKLGAGRRANDTKPATAGTV